MESNEEFSLMSIFNNESGMQNGYFHTEIEKIRKLVININQRYLLELKSPEANKNISLNNKKINFSYERNISHDILENRFDSQIVSRMYHKTVFFNSGIASIYNLLISIKRILRKNNLKIFSTSSYFETGMINDILMSEVIGDSCRGCSNYDVIYIETVDYNELQYHDLIKILEDERFDFPEDKITFVIIDSTLFQDNNIDKAIEKFSDSNIIIIEVISLIKFHQLGMELSNAGSVTFFAEKSMKKIADDMSSYLKKMRSISGSNLTLYEIALLSSEMILDNRFVCEYKNRIYKNARLFFNLLNKPNSLFDIIYPEIGYGEAPFIILRNNNYTLDDYLRYCSLLKRMIEIEDIGIIMGSSFGFNHTRFELIITNEKDNVGFLKIAIGAFDEINQRRFASLINKMHSNESILALLKKYKDIKFLKVDNSE